MDHCNFSFKKKKKKYGKKEKEKEKRWPDLLHLSVGCFFPPPILMFEVPCLPTQQSVTSQLKQTNKEEKRFFCSYFLLPWRLLKKKMREREKNKHIYHLYFLFTLPASLTPLPCYSTVLWNTTYTFFALCGLLIPVFK